MLISKNTSLKSFNTFGLAYIAETMIHVRTEKEAKSLFNGELKWKKPLLIMGGGSNLLFTSDFKGTILRPGFGRIRIEEQTKEHVIVSAGAAVKWDKLVEWCCEKNFWGLENLSGIPGNTGAVPVQNIGAYGVEAKDRVIKVRTLRTADGKIKIFGKDECNFGYRRSIFKDAEKGRYLITRVYFKLSVNSCPNLSYGTLKEEVSSPALKNIRKAVLGIRQSKLPDPEAMGNAGSFFKNPVVTTEFAVSLSKKYPGIPVYDESPGMKKVPAGWLVEQCGWKGKRFGDAGVHEKQALVIVNYGKASGMDIVSLSEKVRKSVKDKFGIRLENEVEVIEA